MELITKFVTIILTMFIIGVLISLPLMFLWNWLMPDIFGLTTITFLQALGLSMLSSMLFKGSNNNNNNNNS